jgi:hypothetical protein
LSLLTFDMGYEASRKDATVEIDVESVIEIVTGGV